MVVVKKAQPVIGLGNDFNLGGNERTEGKEIVSHRKHLELHCSCQ